MDRKLRKSYSQPYNFTEVVDGRGKNKLAEEIGRMNALTEKMNG